MVDPKCTLRHESGADVDQFMGSVSFKTEMEKRTSGSKREQKGQLGGRWGMMERATKRERGRK